MDPRDTQLINSLMDGELDPQEEVRVRKLLDQDADLHKYYRELLRTRGMFQYALYNDKSMFASCRQVIVRRMQPWLSRAAMAGVLVVGVGLGWTLHPKEAQDQLQAYLPNGAVAIRPASHIAANETVRAIIHINSSDAQRVRETLNNAERLLRDYSEAEKKLVLEIIANEDGLKVLRADTSKERERIQLLLATYKNLRFLACGKTLERAKREGKRDVRLIPSVQVVPSALDQIIHRLDDGWTYIRT